MEEYDEFLVQIRKLRKAHRWTQEEAARRLGVSGATWSRWESGVHVPTAHHLRDMAELFGLDPYALIPSFKQAAGKSKLQQRLDEAAAALNNGAAQEVKIGPHTVELCENGALVVNHTIVVTPP